MTKEIMAKGIKVDSCVFPHIRKPRACQAPSLRSIICSTSHIVRNCQITFQFIRIHSPNTCSFSRHRRESCISITFGSSSEWARLRDWDWNGTGDDKIETPIVVVGRKCFFHCADRPAADHIHKNHRQRLASERTASAKCSNYRLFWSNTTLFSDHSYSLIHRPTFKENASW